MGVAGSGHCRGRCVGQGTGRCRCALDCTFAGNNLWHLWCDQKGLGTDPVLGMFIETVMLMPLAIGYILWMQISGMPIFFGGGVVNVAMALFAGVVTVVPLLLYHAGNRALPIIVASLVFYVNPTTQMLVGLLYFEVPFPLHDLWAFALIWTGTAVYFWTRHRQG